MIHKLGEILVQSGAITVSTLEEALKGQVIFGGKLGTNLLEMGSINEETLAKALSKLFSLPCIYGEAIMDLHQSVLSLLQTEFTEKYKVIPIGLEKKRLLLAMVDPRDFEAIEAISFATGYIVSPVVCPEIRMVAALEKHYSIQRDRRHIIHIQGKSRVRVNEPKYSPPPSTTAKDPVETSSALYDSAIDSEEFSFPTDFNFSTDFPDSFGINEQLIPSGHSNIEAQPNLCSKSNEDDNLNSLSELLSVAENRDDIAAALIQFSGKKYEHVALFMIKGVLAIGWMAQHKGENIPNFHLISVPLDSPSVLKLVVDGGSFFMGAMPDSPCNNLILKGLGISKSDSPVLLPISLMGRVVAVFYAGGTWGNLADDVKDLKLLASKAAIALEILILKKKLLSM